MKFGIDNSKSKMLTGLSFKVPIASCLTLFIIISKAASDNGNVSNGAFMNGSISSVENANTTFNQSDLPFVLELSVKSHLRVFEGSLSIVKFNLTSLEPHETSQISLLISVSREQVAVPSETEIMLDWQMDGAHDGRLYNFAQVTHDNETQSSSGSFSIKALGIGNAQVLLSVSYYNNTKRELQTLLIGRIPLSVLRAPRIIDIVFQYSVIVLVVVGGIASSLRIDLKRVKETLKRPKAPVIGFLSQFIIMPLVSYGIIRLRGYTGGRALGLFAYGSGPGGGQSNLYTLLLDGDVSISITMTLISTFACLGMMPLWMYTLGTTLPSNDEFSKEAISIPFVNILSTIAMIILPAGIGLIIRWKQPRFSAAVIRVMDVPLMLVTLAFVGMAIGTNLYIFSFLDLETMLTSAVVPYGGFLLGGLVALAARFEWKLVYTIAIETGINNVGVAVILVQRTLSQPDADLSLIPIIAVQLMAPLPLLLAVFVYTVYKKCFKKKDEDEETRGAKNEKQSEKELDDLKRVDSAQSDGGEEVVRLVG